MNGSLAANSALLAEIKSGLSGQVCNVLVCAPALYLAQCADLLAGSSVVWGAQDVSMHDSGAYTGEISATMLLDLDCKYVIVGHSERRAYHHESNEIVASKALQALNAGIVPIVCVGETLEQRELGQTADVVTAQLRAVLEVLDDVLLSNVVVAYEPVWAIGTGKTATPQMAQDVHAVLRQLLADRSPEIAQKIQILYGGSMKPENAKELLAMEDIDGGLIGGAALKSGDFLSIINAAS
ncbi:triose-phosphate isomerase [soil metagenome]